MYSLKIYTDIQNFNSQIQVTKSVPQMLHMEKKTVVLLEFLVSWLHKKTYLSNLKGKVEKWKSEISIPKPKRSTPDWNQSQLACTYKPLQKTGVGDLRCPFSNDDYFRPTGGKGVHLPHPSLQFSNNNQQPRFLWKCSLYRLWLWSQIH